MEHKGGWKLLLLENGCWLSLINPHLEVTRYPAFLL
jgi:hypothetical protein